MVDSFILKLHEDSDPVKPGSVLGKKSFENSAKNRLKFCGNIVVIVTLGRCCVIFCFLISMFICCLHRESIPPAGYNLILLPNFLCWHEAGSVGGELSGKAGLW